mgnify:CR=1 FL=1
MSNTNYIEQLKKIVEEHHTQYGKFIRKPENKDLLEFINSYESDKLKTNNIQTKIYWILNDIHEFPKCHNPECTNKVTSDVRGIYRGYGTNYPTCCSACAKHTPEYLKNWGDSLEEKYGSRHPMHCQEIKDKVRTTTEERWGGIGFASKELNEKERKIFLEKYNSEDPGNLPEFREKAKHTSNENWGVDNPMKCDEVKQKVDTSNFSKYGSKRYITSKEYWKSRSINPIIISKGEKEVLEFVKSIYSGTIIENDRTQMTPNDENGWIENHELDIWLPEINSAIEYNGTYWHSLPKIIESDKFKKLQCESKGIRLLTITEYDWTNDLHKCKSKILDFLKW